jgi:hypothetical protein
MPENLIASARAFKALSKEPVKMKTSGSVVTVVDSFEGVPELIEPPGDAKSLMSPPDGCRNRDDEPLTCVGLCNGHVTVCMSTRCVLSHTVQSSVDRQLPIAILML